MFIIIFQTGKVEVVTEDAVTALKKAAKWAQSGLVFSTGPPVDITPPEATNGDKKKQNSVTICREKNNELARYAILLYTIFNSR
jgi:E3 ubiquitin-protein ligase HECTD4